MRRKYNSGYLLFRGLGAKYPRRACTVNSPAVTLTKWDYFLAALAAIRARKFFFCRPSLVVRARFLSQIGMSDGILRRKSVISIQSYLTSKGGMPFSVRVPTHTFHSSRCSPIFLQPKREPDLRRNKTAQQIVVV